MKRKTIAAIDPWLEPYQEKLEAQQDYFEVAEARITNGMTLADFALGHLYFGLHLEKDEWVIREWAPGATHLFLLCGKNDWKKDDTYAFTRIENGGGVGITAADGFVNKWRSL